MHDLRNKPAYLCVLRVFAAETHIVRDSQQYGHTGHTPFIAAANAFSVSTG